jgi:hypothetical protein
MIGNVIKKEYSVGIAVLNKTMKMLKEMGVSLEE